MMRGGEREGEIDRGSGRERKEGERGGGREGGGDRL